MDQLRRVRRDVRAALERDPGYPNADLARAFVAAPSQP